MSSLRKRLKGIPYEPEDLRCAWLLWIGVLLNHHRVLGRDGHADFLVHAGTHNATYANKTTRPLKEEQLRTF